jgi:hypothetical protein
VTGSSTEPNRLRHGYTNATSLAGATTVEGRTVVKRYLGPDAVRRRVCEVRALTILAGRFPVPPLIESDDSHVVLGFLPGSPGQEILEERPHEVLFGVGRAGRALHELDLGAAYEVSDGSVLVHGDFGPQNMLFDNATLQMTALVDWEFARRRSGRGSGMGGVDRSDAPSTSSEAPGRSLRRLWPPSDLAAEAERDARQMPLGA